MDNLEEIKKELSELQSKVAKLENESKEEKKGKRWRARINDRYFYVDKYGKADDTLEINDREDDFRYKTRNYFKTEEEAEEYKEVMNTYYDLMDLAEELNNGEKIDWHNEYQCKFPIYYSFKCDTLDEGRAYVCKELGQIYCLDEDFLKKAIKKIGEDKLKKLFTYERS